MNLHLLRLYVTVAERRSFSRAAEALSISQPAVSKGVRELEAQIGVALFERRGRELSLSEAGRTLLRHGRDIFAAERAAQEDLRALRGLSHGAVRIGASTTVASYFVPPYLSAFHARHPGVDLRMVSANTAQIVESLARRDLDLAIVEGPVDREGFETRTWREDPLIVVAAPSHPLAKKSEISGADLASEIFIIREPGSGTRDVVAAALAAAAIVPSRTIEIGSGEAIAHAVASGLGVAIISSALAANLMGLGALRQIEVRGFRVSRLLTRVYIPERRLGPAAVAFDRLLDEADSISGGELRKTRAGRAPSRRSKRPPRVR